MSRQNVPKRPAGAATAMGLVPSIGTPARVGATSGELLVRLTPMKPCVRRAQRVPAGDAVVVGAAEHDRRSSDVPGALDGEVHGDAARVVAPAVLGVEQHQRGPLALHGDRPRDRVHDARLDERHVLRQARRAMGRDASPVGGEQDLRDVLGDVGRGAEALQDRPRSSAGGIGDVEGARVDWVLVDGHGRQAIAASTGP